MHNATLLLVGPNKLSRASLKKLFDGSPFTVVGDAAEIRQIGMQPGADALLGDNAEPDIALVEMSGKTAVLEVLPRLAEAFPDTPVVILLDTVCMETLAACLEAGASGFLTKDITRDAFLRSLELVVLGEIVFPSELARLLALGVSERNRTIGSDDGCELSDREVGVLQCLLCGDSNKVIANRLNITEATIKVHLKSVLRKIKATNRTQAAIWAYGRGYMPAGDAGTPREGPVF